MLRAGLAFAAAIATTAPAYAAGAPDVAVKAVFLAKFGAYVDWPPSVRGEPFSLCIVGRDPFGPLIDEAAEGVKVDGQPLVVHRVPRADAATRCRIAYLGGSDDQPVDAELAAFARSPTLTVTDGAATPTRGVMHFELADRRVRFRVDLVQASAVQLGISSKLLALALSVRQRDGR